LVRMKLPVLAPERLLELPVVPLVPVVPLIPAPPPELKHPVTVIVSLRLLLRLLPDCPLASCAVVCAAAVHAARAKAATVPNTCERFINMPPVNLSVHSGGLQTGRRLLRAVQRDVVGRS